MKPWNRVLLTTSLVASFCCAVLLFGGMAMAATTAPTVSVLPVIKEGAVTPTRIAQDASGKFYVTDPHAEGINVYSNDGKLLNHFVTAVEPGGIAIAKNGDLLVTQGTYVAVLDPANGSEKRRFGSFKLAFYIAVDKDDATGAVPRTSTGRIFVSDIKNYCVQVFDASYNPVNVSTGTAHNQDRLADPTYGTNFIGDSYVYDTTFFYGNGFFNRPAGVEVERNSGLIAVVDSLNGKIKFFDQNGNLGPEFGSFGYLASHTIIRFTYPQSIAFEYSAAGELDRAYVLDTYQSYVMALDATAPIPTGSTPDAPPLVIPWPWLSDIGLYGHDNGDLIAPSDIFVDKKIAGNNKLLISNGFGSITVYGLTNLQPYNVAIDNITSSSLRINWTNTSSPFNFVRVYRSEIEGQLGANVSGNLSNVTTSFVDTPLQQYKTYYYTVRTVDTLNNETTNISQVSAKTTGQFNLSINISGNGQVNGTVSCAGGTCVTQQISDSLVTLTASPAAQSIFEGWTGDCFTTADTCLITMDAAKTVTAFFSAPKAFRVDGAYFDNLQDAYREARDGAVIKVLNGTWPSTTHSTEYMTAWQAKNVTIEGGYDATFTSNAGGLSVVIGRTNLNAGKVVMKQFKIK